MFSGKVRAESFVPKGFQSVRAGVKGLGEAVPGVTAAKKTELCAILRGCSKFASAFV